MHFVYIMASGRNGTLYTGVTNDLIRRVYEHKQCLVDGFTKTYGVKTLVYFETFEEAYRAIQREKNIKHWKRSWKVALIEKQNPNWRDLYPGLVSRQMDARAVAPPKAMARRRVKLRHDIMGYERFL